MSTIIFDHPGWTKTPHGHARSLHADAGTVTTRADQHITGTSAGMVVDTYSPGCLEGPVPQTLRSALDDRGPVQRLRNPDLWDALATAIIRQVIRADQARLMYQRFCAAHGAPVPEGPPVFPRPETVLSLNEDDFTRLGMAFKRRPLLAAAEAFTEFGAKWAELSPHVLVEEVQSVPRIGPWTAGAAVADTTGDFSLYPYGDLAVRTWARRAAPDVGWPTDEPTFSRWWRSFALNSQQLSALTVLTLALGGPRGQEPTPS